MPRITKRLPVCRLHKPSGQARVRHNRREYWVGKFGSQEAAEAYAALLTRLASGELPAEAPAASAPSALHLLSIAELIEKFWAHSQVYYRKHGVLIGEHKVNQAALRPLLRRFGPERTAVDIEAQAGARGHDRPEMVEALHQRLRRADQAAVQLGGRRGVGSRGHRGRHRPRRRTQAGPEPRPGETGGRARGR